MQKAHPPHCGARSACRCSSVASRQPTRHSAARPAPNQQGPFPSAATWRAAALAGSQGCRGLTRHWGPPLATPSALGSAAAGCRTARAPPHQLSPAPGGARTRCRQLTGQEGLLWGRARRAHARDQLATPHLCQGPGLAAHSRAAPTSATVIAIFCAAHPAKSTPQHHAAFPPHPNPIALPTLVPSPTGLPPHPGPHPPLLAVLDERHEGALLPHIPRQLAVVAVLLHCPLRILLRVRRAAGAARKGRWRTRPPSSAGRAAALCSCWRWRAGRGSQEQAPMLPRPLFAAATARSTCNKRSSLQPRSAHSHPPTTTTYIPLACPPTPTHSGPAPL